MKPYRKAENLFGKRDHSAEDKWIPATWRNWPLSAENPPSQTEVILMAFEVKGNPNPHIPPTRVSDSTTQSMHSESSAAPPTTRVQGRARWREMGGEKWRKTVVQSSKSNMTMLFLSPSASLTSCWSGRMSECHIFHLDPFCAFPFTSLFGISWQQMNNF